MRGAVQVSHMGWNKKCI